MSEGEPGIYRHADGGYYYIVERCEIKHPDEPAWIPGIAYRSVNGGKLYTTTCECWAEWFTIVIEPEYEPQIEEDPGRQFQNRSVQDDLALATTIVKAVMPQAEKFHQVTSVDVVRNVLGQHLTRMWSDIVSFHEKYQLAYRGPPRALPADQELFRILFIAEELEEYAETPGLVDWLRNALAQRGVLEDTLERRENRLDALVDMAYVVFGTAYLHGFNFAEAWRRVQRANMAKIRCERPADSKRGSGFDVIKPAGWEAPSHKDLVGSLEPRVYPEGILEPAMADNVPEGFFGPEVEVLRVVVDANGEVDYFEAEVEKVPANKIQHDLF